MLDKEEILNDPEKLKIVAAKLRAEAERADARAEKLKAARAQPVADGVTEGCWPMLPMCIAVYPA